MAKSLLANSRLLHRWLAPVFFIFFLLIAVTGLMLGWKAMFSSVLYENKNLKVETNLKNWLPVDSLALLAGKRLNTETGKNFKEPDRMEIRLKKGLISFSYANMYYVQIEGRTGNIIRIEKRPGGWIQDIHDGAVLDNLINSPLFSGKKIYSSLMGLVLLLMSVTGFYLWYRPQKIRKKKTV